MKAKPIKFGCPWGKAPCGREDKEREKRGCMGCPAFNEEEYNTIMTEAMSEEAEIAQTKAEIEQEREFLSRPENYFGPWENQW